MNPTAELTIRLAAFAAVLAVMALWELVAPRRSWAVGRAARWPGNLGIVALDAVAVRLVIPTAALGVALLAETDRFGLFHWFGWPALLAGVVGFVLLDAAIYGQHVAFHHVPWLWRLHRMHHADLDIDVTTGVRFHPFEILLSMFIKMAAVALFGIPVVAVLAFEIALNATTMFNHANVALPAWLDRAARLIVVTPDMHRVHHSVLRTETDSNFGFNLPWWDWLFGTYRAAPALGHEDMTVGLPVFRDARELRLGRLLTQPFREPTDEHDPAPTRAGETRRS